MAPVPRALFIRRVCSSARAFDSNNITVMKANAIEHLGSPDLEIAGLQVWVHGYQFPDADDAWDGNWLRATAHCGASGASVWVSGAFLDTVAIRRFLDGLVSMHATLAGMATLETDEPELSLRASVDERTGHVDIHVEITPDQLMQQHAFRFDADQSYLPAAIAQCRRLLDRYPIRHAAHRTV